MKLTNRERNLIIFAILLAVFVGYFILIFKPLYGSFINEKDKYSELNFELVSLNQSVDSVEYLKQYNQNLQNKKLEIDIFRNYLYNDEIEQIIATKGKKYGYEVIGFMVGIDTDIKVTQSIKQGIDVLTVKYITVTLKGNLLNISSFIKDMEKDRSIELRELKYIENRHIPNDESFIIEFCYYLKDIEYER